MIKFSRSGWNNVIIFAVMGFILLINATHDNVFSSKTSVDKAQFLLGENAVILTLSINQQLKIERIGKTWRAMPGHIHGQALEQMMMSWQQATGNIVDAPENIDQQLALIVSAEMAGQPEAVVFSLHLSEDELLIFNHKLERWFSLPSQLFSQLIPSQVFGE